MKILILFLSFSATLNLLAQENYGDSIKTLREEHISTLFDPSKGILNDEDLKHLEKLDYFELDSNYIIEAKWTKNKGRRFKMPTSTERKPIYKRYGYIEFSLKDSTHVLTVYQNMELKNKKEFKNYFFVPFRDETSGISSYGGGRYLDLHLYENQTTVLIDFNTIYNPYCAYSHRYSCPIPPEENTLLIEINAGEKTPIYK